MPVKPGAGVKLSCAACAAVRLVTWVKLVTATPFKNSVPCEAGGKLSILKLAIVPLASVPTKGCRVALPLFALIAGVVILPAIGATLITGIV